VSQKLQNDDGELMEMQIEMAMWMRLVAGGGE